MARAPVIVFGFVAVSALLGGSGCGGGKGAAGSSGNGGAAGMGGAGGAAGRGGAAQTGGTGGVAGTGGSGGAAGGSGTTGTGGAAADAGTTGSAGGAGTIGAAGTGGPGGDGGRGGAAGTGGSGGTAGTGSATSCTFAVTSSLSTAIPTVGIVTFTTDLAAISSAEIRFGLASTGPTMTAPVDLTKLDHRTLLLGMKGSSAYVFRIVATSAAGTCTSADYTLMTGSVPAGVPNKPPTMRDPVRQARGFILSCNTNGLGPIFIIDSDGAPVWWMAMPFQGTATRAHMSWDGNDMYVVWGSAAGASGDVARISMDGLVVEEKLSGLRTAHHDLTAIPGGVAALLTNSVVERSGDGTITTAIPDLIALYGNGNHSNSIHYDPSDDSYTVGDTGSHLYAKITRQGNLVWQFGGAGPKDPSKAFPGVPRWEVAHGHHLLSDGTFVFFDNNYLDPGTVGAIARVFKLDTTTMTATSVRSYQSGLRTNTLGDVQFLRNGDILMTVREAGAIREIDPSGQVVAQHALGISLGYSEFRESLYGPPPY
ncbi:MAG TPA: arylsulfotransferase family protein [Polyangia bacterium]|jgi:hypothetical protein